jgi:hypothetical protein
MPENRFTAQRPSTASGSPNALRIAVVVAVAVAALSALWGASESHYRSCVAAAQARFPAVPVSAFSGRGVGPVKVSFVKERTAAVDDCHRL